MSEAIARSSSQATALLFVSAYLSPEEVALVLTVSKLWKGVFDQTTVWKRQCRIQGYRLDSPIKDYKEILASPPPNAFYPKDYSTYFGAQVMNPKSRPLRMRYVNNQQDPKSPKEKMGETHLWIYNPGSVEVKNYRGILSTDILMQLAMAPAGGGYRAKFNYFTQEISEAQKEASMGDAGWFLIRKSILPMKIEGYELPSGPEAILAAIVWRVKTGLFLFRHGFTRTSTMTADGTLRWIVGGFDQEGLSVIDYHDRTIGYSGVQRFT